ncbi:MAG: polysulfide reductase NrfD, partial [marine benthic group bacterium]|nr:polysulfide reductase NrfD [Candidatus Benthicola marisminoris]
KCNFCAHRLDVGLEPACVVVCPTQAILVGDMNDPASLVGETVGRQPVAVRRPEKETHPKLFYVGAHQATLDPLAAARPDGGLFMWSEQGDVPHGVPAGNPGHANSSAAAMLAYDVPHRAPWDYRVSLYTWTKSVSAGAYVATLLLLLLGLLEWSNPLWTWGAPLVALAFLGLTGVILIWDLEHPTRFHYLLLKPQWSSWLVWGGFIISGYGAVLAAHLAAGWFGRPELQKPLAIAGGPLGVMAAVYTAYLFAQAKARDLWQSPLLPPHLAAQAVLAGSGAMLLVATVVEPGAVRPLAWMFAASAAVHLVVTVGEITLTHGTAHAHLATREMTRGKYARFFWVSMLLTIVALAAPWLAVPAVVAGLIGLLAFEHAYVQAGQSVPLA